MSIAIAIPEGFVSNEQSSSLVFQNPTNWLKAEAEGAMVAGVYEGLTEKDNFGKQNIKITATSPGVSFDKEGNTKEFEAGTTVIVNASAGISKKMATIELGTEVCIAYNGQNVLREGAFKGKKAHSYTVIQKSA